MWVVSPGISTTLPCMAAGGGRRGGGSLAKLCPVFGNGNIAQLDGAKLSNYATRAPLDGQRINCFAEGLSSPRDTCCCCCFDAASSAKLPFFVSPRRLLSRNPFTVFSLSSPLVYVPSIAACRMCDFFSRISPFLNSY